MAKYLLQASYTPEAWAAMVKDPKDRRDVVGPAVEGLGGKLGETYFAFGEYDIVAFIDMPDNVDAAAFSIAAAAGGGVKNVKTTPLLTVEEAMESMRKAQKVAYVPPQKS